jgi:putative flippase GtrA
MGVPEPVVIRIRQLVRYAAVSGIATGVSQVVLATLVATRATSAVEANVIATMVGTVPSFELNRRWVWGKSGNRSLAKEVIPFAAISASGLLLSTLAVAVASRWAEARGFSGAERTATVQAANLAAFGLVWVAQFVLLDRVLFRSRPRRNDSLLGFPECSMDELSRL